ncbi:MAG: cysteine synthase [Zestosphaera tikiterensis]|uniref:Cysteine synthase n=1 Tax=Zestosphaera tikiterensis TaxID=1973259 RepID=A0A2R7Y6N7_9CREN|nr:MAG: cysteine synthase [Zestosphaera tikiterensis]
MKRGVSIADVIGNTPIIRLGRSIPEDVKAEIWVKLEFMNPTGSVKDRMALYMIKKAEREGRLTKDKTIVVATTGNTGIAFAALGAALGYKVMIVIPEEMSAERFMLISHYGAEIVKVPGGESDAFAALKYGKELEEKHPDKYVFLDQWDDEANVEAHYETTGAEILQQLNSVDAFVAHIGTGGTLVGIAKRLKERNPKTLIVGAEPAECPVAYHWFYTGKEGPWGRHEIEGVGDGFVPNIIRKYRHLIDHFEVVTSDEAISMAKKLARYEGLAVGISSGANVMAAIKIARRFNLSEGSKIVTILPDYAARYFSTRLFK